MYSILPSIPDRHLISFSMSTEEFRAYYREQVRDILNRLQSVMLVFSQLEGAVSDIGQSIQGLTEEVEAFINNTQEEDQPPSS